MTTDTNTLLTAARCFKCLPPGSLREVMIYLLAQWAQKKSLSTLGTVWIDQPMIDPANMNGGTALAFGNGLFSVTGYGPYWSNTTPDGINYIRGPSDMLNVNWSSMAYGAGVYVVCGGSGNQLMYSSDGLVWITATSNYQYSTFYSVTFGLGLFVSVGGSVPVIHSSDGINWFFQTAPTASWRSVCYGGGLFVAVGDSNKVMTSSDGLSWTLRTSPVVKNWSSVTFGNGLFVAFTGDNSGVTIHSSNGINWFQGSCPPLKATGSCYGSGVYVVVGDGTGQQGQTHASIINTSTNGLDWVQRVNSQAGVPDYIFAVAYGNGMFLALRNTTGYYTSVGTPP